MPSDPSSASSWRAAAEQGDYESARALWAQLHAGAPESLAANRDLAEIEERVGDLRVLTDPMQAKRHYLWASDAIREAMNLASRSFDKRSEEARAAAAREITHCQAVHTRTFCKYQSISNQGRVDDLGQLVPHPASTTLKDRIVELCQARRTEQAQSSARADAALDAPDDGRTGGRDLREALESSEYARAVGMDPSSQFGLGERWYRAAHALVERWPACARRTLYWSRHFLGQYHASWTAHAPASRWDPDGSEEITAALGAIEALAGKQDAAPIPAWAHELLCGRLREAVGKLDSGAAPRAFEPLFDLLAQGCENEASLSTAVEQRRPVRWT